MLGYPAAPCQTCSVLQYLQQMAMLNSDLQCCASCADPRGHVAVPLHCAVLHYGLCSDVLQSWHCTWWICYAVWQGGAEIERPSRAAAAEEEEEEEGGEDKAEDEDLRAIQLSRTQLENMCDKLFFEGGFPGLWLHKSHHPVIVRGGLGEVVCPVCDRGRWPGGIGLCPVCAVYLRVQVGCRGRAIRWALVCVCVCVPVYVRTSMYIYVCV